MALLSRLNISSRVPTAASTIPPKQKREIARSIMLLTTQYYPSALPPELIKIFKSRGYLFLDDDQTEWSGFLTGSHGRATFAIGISSPLSDGTYPLTSSFFNLQWYQMPSGKYELNGYLS